MSRLIMATTVDSGNETLFSDDSSCDLLETSSTSACSSGDLVSSSTLDGNSTTADGASEQFHSVISLSGNRIENSTNSSSASIISNHHSHCTSNNGTNSGTRGSDCANNGDNVAPPKIQPCSGVLGKGKVVIRPIAFKPMGMPSAARFGNSGERYGSTPILPRAGSHLAFYGSTNDLHHQRTNYSLDRKHISSCTSTASSPPLGMASLSSLPLSSSRKMNYDSLESVRKSPTSTINSHSNNRNKSAYGLLSGVGGCSLIDLTPSPSDSGVSELEAALRDRDSELAYLRQTMEHNEQVIFRVYQEKERVWERELRRLKTVHENRIRASAQKAHKLEQLLMMQTYQLQQEKKRLSAENERVAREAAEMRHEVNILRSRLEETEWGLCQKTGEISLLKSQLKEAQNDHTTRGHELLQLRGEFRDVREDLDRREDDLTVLRQNAHQKDIEVKRLQEEVEKLKLQLQETGSSVCHRQDQLLTDNERLKAEVRELREELSEVAMSEYEGIEDGRSLRGLHHQALFFPLHSQTDSEQSLSYFKDETDEQNISGKPSEEVEKCSDSQTLHYPYRYQHQCPDLAILLDEMNTKLRDFDQERITWAEEKEKVLKYQRQLQLNYVQMYRRTRALENEVENLTMQLDLVTKHTNNSLNNNNNIIMQNNNHKPVERSQAVEL